MISSNPIGLSPEPVDLFRFPTWDDIYHFESWTEKKCYFSCFDPSASSVRWCLANMDVSLQPRPSGLRILQPGPIVLDPSEHVKEASSPLVISIWQRLVPQIPNLVKIGRLNVMLRIPGDYCSLDLLLPELPEKLLPGFIEHETAANLDLLLSPQLHLLEKTESYFSGLFEI